MRYIERRGGTPRIRELAMDPRNASITLNGVWAECYPKWQGLGHVLPVVAHPWCEIQSSRCLVADLQWYWERRRYRLGHRAYRAHATGYRGEPLHEAHPPPQRPAATWTRASFYCITSPVWKSSRRPCAVATQPLQWERRRQPVERRRQRRKCRRMCRPPTWRSTWRRWSA